MHFFLLQIIHLDVTCRFEIRERIFKLRQNTELGLKFVLLKKRNKRELVQLCNHSKTTYRLELLQHHRPRFNIFGKNQLSREKVVIQSYVRNVRLKPWTNFY